MEAVSLRQKLSSLDIQRKSLEAESEAIVDELTSTPPSGGVPMGIDTPLVDKEGFPRNDIDVFRARTLRNRFNQIRTDHKKLMKEIEALLIQLAAVQDPEREKEVEREKDLRRVPKPKPKMDPVTGKWVVPSWDGSIAGVAEGNQRSFENLQATEEVAATMTTTTLTQEQNTPFAKVDGVAPDSPAAEAGLEVGDLIVQFGNIDLTNHDNFRAIVSTASLAAVNQFPVTIAVLRNDNNVQVTMRPKPWSGRGLIGCHIVPYSQ